MLLGVVREAENISDDLSPDVAADRRNPAVIVIASGLWLTGWICGSLATTTVAAATAAIKGFAETGGPLHRHDDSSVP